MSYNPGSGPYNNPQITISTPLAPPPQQFTNVATLIDGGYREAGIMLFLNGLLQTEGLDYTRVGGQVTMVAPPGAGDALTACVFAIGRQLGGPTPERYLAPWTFRLTGDFDRVGTAYQIVFGPTISGTCDGRNSIFGVGVTLQRMKIFRNGLLQTFGVDVSCGPTAFVFLPGAVPVAGDILTVLGY